MYVCIGALVTACACVYGIDNGGGVVIVDVGTVAVTDAVVFANAVLLRRPAPTRCVHTPTGWV